MHFPVITAPALLPTWVDNNSELGDTPWVTFAVDGHSPPEPPPSNGVTWPAPAGFKLNDVLAALPCDDHDASVDQYLRDEVAALTLQPDMNHNIHHCRNLSCLVIPQVQIGSHTPPPHCKLVTYHVPMDKAQPCADSTYLQGSILDPSIFIRPVSPTTPFDFPFAVPTPYRLPDLGYNPSTYVPFASVTRVVGLPCICGLTGNDASFA
jgi:hypothetical protein